MSVARERLWAGGPANATGGRTFWFVLGLRLLLATLQRGARKLTVAVAAVVVRTEVLRLVDRMAWPRKVRVVLADERGKLSTALLTDQRHDAAVPKVLAGCGSGRH